MPNDVYQVLVLREDVWGRTRADILKILKRAVPGLDTTEVWIPACDASGAHDPAHSFAPYLLIPHPAPASMARVWCIERVIPGSVTRREMTTSLGMTAAVREGQRVEVTEGPLVGLVGDVEAVRSLTAIVCVTLESGNRRVSVPLKYLRGV